MYSVTTAPNIEKALVVSAEIASKKYGFDEHGLRLAWKERLNTPAGRVVISGDSILLQSDENVIAFELRFLFDESKTVLIAAHVVRARCSLSILGFHDSDCRSKVFERFRNVESFKVEADIVREIEDIDSIAGDQFFELVTAMMLTFEKSLSKEVQLC